MVRMSGAKQNGGIIRSARAGGSGMNDIRRERLDLLRRMADRVCTLILISDYPDVDIEIEMQKVRQKCEELFPDRLWLYDMIYEARFRRLREQFRR
jgi:hypothetical protein